MASLAECGTFHDCLFLETLQLLFLYQKTLMLPVPAGSHTFFWREAQLKHPFFQETLPDTQEAGLGIITVGSPVFRLFLRS